jgi:predicted ATP-dependent serine protease
MAYFCKDCSYRGKNSGQGGKCPACGSFNIGAERFLATTQQEGSPLWHKIALVTSWSLLLALVAWKLIN